MQKLTMSTHYDAPIERVFEFATDFERYPEWNVNYVKVDKVSGPIQVGTKLHGVIKLLGRQFEGDGEILEIQPPHLLKVRSQTPEGWTTFLYRFTVEPTGTLATYEFEYELKPGIFGQVVDKLFVERAVERDLTHSLENSKAFIEAKVPVLV